jgi:membrane-associated PAP2 superfamily phosphatase
MINFRDRRFLITHLVMPLLVMLPILVGFELTNWDVGFQHLFYIPGAHDDWLINSKSGWVETYLHDGGKTLTHIYGDLFIVGLILSFYKERFKPFRQDFIFIISAVILATSIVSFLKHATNINCPTNLTIFGGSATYVKIFEPRILGDKYGICWPSGHASAGFAFLSAYFVVVRHWPRYAWLALLGGLGMGILFGSVRMLQGQHFLSHTLWSGIICWVVMVLLAMVVFKNKNNAQAPNSAGSATNT